MVAGCQLCVEYHFSFFIIPFLFIPLALFLCAFNFLDYRIHNHRNGALNL